MFKNRSKTLFTLVTIESLFCLWLLFYFNYLDRLNYSQSITTTTNDLILLIQNMYTSTWWALIILVVTLATIFSLVCLIYRDIKYQFMAIILWGVLFILALDVKDSFGGVLSILAIFIPIITVNIMAYCKQQKINNKKPDTKKTAL